jgi:hypothetical protein
MSSAICGVAALHIRGLTQRVRGLYIANRPNSHFNEVQSMKRQFTTTNACALSGAAAFVCVSARMTLGSGSMVFIAAGLRSPGEGDAASP